MTHCPRCSAPVTPDAAHCSACGIALEVPSRPRVTLRVVRADGGPETTMPLHGETLTCGKNGDIPILDDPFVAPVQVRFYFAGPHLAVEDAGGGNGVFVRLRQTLELPVGSELRVGRQRLLLEGIPPPAVGRGGAIAWGSPDSGSRLRLIQYLEGGLRGSAYPLKEGENSIGRESSDVSFPGDGFVSGKHASVTASGDRATVQDLGSSNGTFIRLTTPTYVNAGDQFLIGRQLLRVEIQP